jgi:flagellar protein FlgJ
MATIREQKDFVRQVYPAAYRLYAEKDSINPLFVTAQAALETGWKIKGTGNNIFGITKGSWTGKTELVLTAEIFNNPGVKFREPERIAGIESTPDGKFRYRVYRQFRSYDSLEECLDDHLNVLRGSGYADAWPYRKDPKEFAIRIVDNAGAKYATDPNYARIMGSVIDTVKLRIKDIQNETPVNTVDHAVFFRLPLQGDRHAQ